MFLKNKFLFPILLFLFCVLPHGAEAITPALAERYAHAATGDKVRILIVPGHDDEYSGTEYRGVREADLNLTLANELVRLLKIDPHFAVTATRTEVGYTPEFENYFTNNRSAILDFARTKRKTTSDQITSGTIKSVESVPHNSVNDDIAVRLYGINKWANEHAIDLIIHVHLNDTPSRTKNNPGVYNGITVYIPESQYGNAALSKEFGGALYNALLRKFTPSTMPSENAGLVEDQTLIAVGASNTLASAASALIEYGYIYEPQFLNNAVAKAVLSDMAYQTFIGVHEFFGDAKAYKNTFDTSLLPYTWSRPLPAISTYSLDVLHLEVALRSVGMIPAEGFGRQDCRVIGIFSPCTEAALKAFQKKNGLEQTGTLGPRTRAALNKRFGK